jgi:UDP-N-acetylmuramoyl-L-alanyl-D-glutamate--2,6-diaminopimelate ligase
LDGEGHRLALGQVLAGVRLKSEIPDALLHAAVAGLDYDSRRVEAGHLFFAFAGARADGRAFAQAALDRGAIAIVSELPAPEGFPGPWIVVEHGRKALALAARNFYGKPDERLGITGITGTNGKTTTCFLLDAILRTSGKTTALIGTIQYRLAGEVLPAVNTTPESLDLYKIFDQLLDLGGTHVTMEVSSHALALGRVHGVRFHTAVFTNLTRDHLDFHGGMEDYFAAKRLLFVPEGAPPPAFAVINHDDPWGAKIDAPGSSVLRYGFNAGAGVRGSALEMNFEGLSFTVEHEGRSVRLRSPLVGKINAYNILAAACGALSYGLDWDVIADAVSHAARVPGRFESIDAGQPFMVVVDYAHTDDALRNVIAVARELKPSRVLTLFGCGGDRDRAKRPLMGAAAAEGSDFVALTSDNPRSEDPLDIINDAQVGLGRFDTPYITEPDREKAIRAILVAARPGDIVIIAGKGHETYQVLKDRTIHFDDRETARAILQSMGYGKTE